jgi:hypothetical protein
MSCSQRHCKADGLPVQAARTASAPRGKQYLGYPCELPVGESIRSGVSSGPASPQSCTAEISDTGRARAVLASASRECRSTATCRAPQSEVRLCVAPVRRCAGCNLQYDDQRQVIGFEYPSARVLAAQSKSSAVKALIVLNGRSVRDPSLIRPALTVWFRTAAYGLLRSSGPTRLVNNRLFCFNIAGALTLSVPQQFMRGYNSPCTPSKTFRK